MKALYPYKSLEDTLLMLKRQVRDSIPFAQDFLPRRRMSPAEIFATLKKNVVYWNDPSDRELLQSMPTLLSRDNVHKIYGAGDCDCFTIAALACLIAKGYKDNFVVIVGRNNRNAVHIYCKTMNNGKKETLDLTNHSFDYERYYPYRQELPLKV